MKNYAIISIDDRYVFEESKQTLEEALEIWRDPYFTPKGRKLVKVGNYPCGEAKLRSWNDDKDPVFPIVEIIKVGE